MTIQEYDFGNHYNHAPKAERKLLLNKKELKKLEKEVKNSGLTIIPLKLFINEKGFAKLFPSKELTTSILKTFPLQTTLTL